MNDLTDSLQQAIDDNTWLRWCLVISVVTNLFFAASMQLGS
jgi:hypothetical protein